MFKVGDIVRFKSNGSGTWGNGLKWFGLPGPLRVVEVCKLPNNEVNDGLVVVQLSNPNRRRYWEPSTKEAFDTRWFEYDEFLTQVSRNKPKGDGNAEPTAEPGA